MLKYHKAIDLQRYLRQGTAVGKFDNFLTLPCGNGEILASTCKGVEPRFPCFIVRIKVPSAVSFISRYLLNTTDNSSQIVHFRDSKIQT